MAETTKYQDKPSALCPLPSAFCYRNPIRSFKRVNFAKFKEKDHPVKTALAEEKHWHIFQIIACKA